MKVSGVKNKILTEPHSRQPEKKERNTAEIGRTTENEIGHTVEMAY